jgi:hypothetical protein
MVRVLFDLAATSSVCLFQLRSWKMVTPK